MSKQPRNGIIYSGTFVTLVMLLFLTCIIGCIRFTFTQSLRLTSSVDHLDDIITKSRKKLKPFFNQGDLAFLLRETPVSDLGEPMFEFTNEEATFVAQTSINGPVQKKISDLLKTHNSQRWTKADAVSVALIDPETGRIKAFDYYENGTETREKCFSARFPAASVFKVVTAAAAIEKCNLTYDTPLTFNGRKHTLYRYQLKDKTHRYTNRTTLRKSFAESINPIFGKLGVHYVGGKELHDFADSFGFNSTIPFDMPLAISRVDDSMTESYEIAELASGFNRETQITAIHGALMAATVANKGTLPVPGLIYEVKTENGALLYKHRPSVFRKILSSKSSEQLAALMKATITNGTCRSTFRRASRDSILSRLDIYGKTGSIGSADHTQKYDLFVGYASEKGGAEKVAIAVIVAHGEYLGTRAPWYARNFLKYYFEDYFERKETLIAKLH